MTDSWLDIRSVVPNSSLRQSVVGLRPHDAIDDHACAIPPLLREARYLVCIEHKLLSQVLHAYAKIRNSCLSSGMIGEHGLPLDDSRTRDFARVTQHC